MITNYQSNAGAPTVAALALSGYAVLRGGAKKSADDGVSLISIVNNYGRTLVQALLPANGAGSVTLDVLHLSRVGCQLCVN